VKKYLVKWNKEIYVVEVEKETEKSVWRARELFGKKVLERELKISEFSKYFDTWDEAHNHLLGVAERGLKSAQKRLDDATYFLDIVTNMKKL
jgi:hypothetical protein